MSAFRIIVPPIKCQGIKTKLVPWIKAIVPDTFNGRWIEPFMGSGVVAFNLRPKKALLADSNPHLIAFYKAIANGAITPSGARKVFEEEGAELLRSEGQHFYAIRERFNRTGDPMDFLFLNRSCFNGMIRFNRKGGFNVPFCRKPNRFAQAYVTKICNQIKTVSDAISCGDYEFRNQDFHTTIESAGAKDFLYCDPPYIDRHADYFNGWDESHERDLAKHLGAAQAKFILSTWHSNEFRSNHFIDSIWNQYHILTREHFYHVGGSEENRNPMLEALITNFDPNYEDQTPKNDVQLQLLESPAIYRTKTRPA